MYLYLVLLYTCLGPTSIKLSVASYNWSWSSCKSLASVAFCLPVLFYLPLCNGALQNDGIVALPRTTPMSKHGKHLPIHIKTAELIDLVNKFYHDDNKPGNAGKIRLNKSQSKFKGEQGNSRDIDDGYTNTETVMKLLQKNYDAHKKYAPSGTDTIRLHVISNPEVVKEYQQRLKSAYIDRSSSSESSDEDYFDRKLREVLLRRNFVNFRLSSGDVSSETLNEQLEEVKVTQGTVRFIDDEVTPFKQQLPESDEMTNLEILLNSPDFIVENEEKEIGKEVIGPHIEQIASKSGAWGKLGDKLVTDKENGKQNWENNKRREKTDTWETKKDSNWNKKDNWNKKSEGRKEEENKWMKEDAWKKPDEWNKKTDDLNKNKNDWNKKNSDWNKKPDEWNKKNNDWNKKPDDWNKKFDDRDKQIDTWENKDNWEKKYDWDKKNNAREDIWNPKDKETFLNWNKKENTRNKDVDWYTKNKKNQRDIKKDWDNKYDDGNIKDNDWDKPKIDWDNDRDRKKNKNNGRDKKENTNYKEWDKNDNTWDKKNVVLDQKHDNWDNKNIARGASDLMTNKKRKKKDRDYDDRNLDRDETKALQSYERETTKKYNVKKIDNSWDNYVPKNDDYNYRPKKNKRMDNYERNDARPMAGGGHSFGRTSIPFAGRQRIYDK